MTSERKSSGRGQETDGSIDSGDSGGSSEVVLASVADEHIRPAYCGATTSDPDVGVVQEQLRAALDALARAEQSTRSNSRAGGH